MCIRDSPRIGTGGVDESKNGQPETLRHRQPVSYTHLRAHETPEHLVCRLLLEKKTLGVVCVKVVVQEKGEDESTLGPVYMMKNTGPRIQHCIGGQITQVRD